MAAHKKRKLDMGGVEEQWAAAPLFVCFAGFRSFLESAHMNEHNA